MAPTYENTCPTCGAAGGMRCRTLTTGRATDTHTARIERLTDAAFARVIPATSQPGPCPECAQGKHPNCDGSTWNDRLDAYDACPCHTAGHR